MKDISTSNFGLLIAYLIPGFIVVWAVQGWWPGSPTDTAALPSLLTFLNSTVAAIAAGMAVSAIRFVVVDTIQARTGLRRPAWVGHVVQANIEAITTAIEQHYRYYQFHANALVAVSIAFVFYRTQTVTPVGWIELVWLILVIVFWVTARDNLAKYYRDLESIFSHMETIMSNGKHHDTPDTTNDTVKKAKDQQQPTGPIKAAVRNQEGERTEPPAMKQAEDRA